MLTPENGQIHFQMLIIKTFWIGGSCEWDIGSKGKLNARININTFIVRKLIKFHNGLSQMLFSFSG